MNVTWPFALATATNLMTHRAVSGTEDAASTACTVLAYATFHAVCCASDYLSDAFVDLDFNFFGKELDGQSELKPRWKRVVRHADSLIGELVGKAYVAAHFPEHSKVAAELLVGNVHRRGEGALNRTAVDGRRDESKGAGEDGRVSGENRVPRCVDLLRRAFG